MLRPASEFATGPGHQADGPDDGILVRAQPERAPDECRDGECPGDSQKQALQSARTLVDGGYNLVNSADVASGIAPAPLRELLSARHPPAIRVPYPRALPRRPPAQR